MLSKLSIASALFLSILSVSACCQPPEKSGKDNPVTMNQPGQQPQGNIQPGNYAPGELLVRFKENIDKKTRESIISAQSATIIKEYSFAPLYHIRLPEDTPVMAGKKLFGDLPEVEYAEPNFKRKMLNK